MAADAFALFPWLKGRPDEAIMRGDVQVAMRFKDLAQAAWTAAAIKADVKRNQMVATVNDQYNYFVAQLKEKQSGNQN